MESLYFEKGIKHTAHGLNFYLSYFDDIARVLPRDCQCFIVGGWVRDRILGEPVEYKIDIDLLLTCDPVKVAQDFAKMVGGSYFEFEKKGLLRRPTIATVIIKLPPYKYRFDFAQIKGRDVEKALVDDLLSRDFTANAMAVSIDDVLSIGAKQTIIYDPAHGMEDLEKGLLRPVSLKNLEEDPVRILRGFRLSVEKSLELTEDFFKFVREKPHLIKKAPVERLTLELLKVFKHKESGKVIRALYENSILQQIIPEIERWKEIKEQGNHHKYSLEEHMLRVMEAIDQVVENRERYLPVELLEPVGHMEFLGEFSDVELLKISLLLHDVAKPHAFEVRDGKITFYNHDKLGAQIAKEVGKRLKLGEGATKLISSLVEHHLRPFYLRESFKKEELTSRGKAKFWRDCGEIAPWLFLHSIADAIGSGDEEEEIMWLLKTLHELWEFKRQELEKIPVKPLLSGEEIMSILNLSPGPKVGEVKKALEQAQWEGIVKTKEDAVKFLKERFT
ncbi:HD domain-containing protein [Thermocrinis sp.]